MCEEETVKCGICGKEVPKLEAVRYVVKWVCDECETAGLMNEVIAADQARMEWL